MKNINRLIILISIIIMGQSAAGQMSADTLNLDEILITAHRKVAISHSNINGKIIELQSPHDGGQIFKSQPGFSVLKKGNYGMEPVLRGFKYGQLNIQFDGGIHSTNACPNRMDPAISQISIEDIQKVEVINGPYSVRFGPVFGGIVNIISKRPQFVAGKIVSSSVDAGYQSNGNNFYSDIFTQVVRKKIDLSVNAGYKNYGNYKSGSGQEIASSFKRIGYTAKLGINPAENQRIQLAFRQSFARDVLYAGLPMDADEDNSSILSVDYGINHLSDAIFSFKVKAFGSSVTHLMTNNLRPNYMMSHASTPVNAKNYGGRAELGISMGARNVVFVGADFQHIGKDGSRTREVFVNSCTGVSFDPPKVFHDLVWQNSSKNDGGIFLENKFQVNSALSWQTGLRLDFVSYSIKDPAADFSELYSGNITPSDRVTFAITSNLDLKLSEGFHLLWAAARAEHAPDLVQLYINHLSVGMDAYEYVGNPFLKPEINYQTDLKLVKRWKNVSFLVDGFFSYLNNYITAKVNQDIPRKFLPCKLPRFTKQFVNIDQALMSGFETTVKVSFMRYFEYNFGASYTYAQNLSWDEPLSEIPPFSMNNGFSYKTEKLETRFNARMVSAQNRVSSLFNESATPGFAVYDLYLVYSPVRSVKISASVTNLLDKNYVEHLSRPYKNMDAVSSYYEPGRSFNIGVKWIF